MCTEALGIGVVEVDDTTRLGKKMKDLKPRPLKITLKNTEDKAHIFQHLRRLTDADKKFSVSVTADLQPEDRKLVKDKVEEAKQMKKTQNEGGRWIYRVRGPPWNLKIVKLPSNQN